MHRCYCASSHNWISNSNRFHVVRQICEVDSLHQKLHPCGLLHTLGCVPQHVCPGLHNNREIYTALQQYLTWKLDKSLCSLPITHFSTVVVLEDANSATRWTSAVITDKWVRSFGVSKNQPLNSWELCHRLEQIKIKICLGLIFITFIIYLESKRKESVHSSFKFITPTTAPLKTRDWYLLFLFIFWSLRIQNKNQSHKNNIYKTDYWTEVTEAT